MMKTDLLSKREHESELKWLASNGNNFAIRLRKKTAIIRLRAHDAEQRKPETPKGDK